MNTKLHQLEGLRGVAALVVLLSHLRLTFFVDSYDRVNACMGGTAAILFEGMLDGKFAVWLFWVMSAFVLSLRYHATTDRATGCALMTDATVRRYPRLLLPVIGSVFFAWFLHRLGLMSNVKLAKLLGYRYEDWLGKFYVFEPSAIEAIRCGVWQTFFEYNESTSYNPVLWTMEIELYGSLFLFAFLALVGKHPSRILIYVATILVVYKLSLHWINAFVIGTMIGDAFVNRDQLSRFVPSALRDFVARLIHSRWVAVMAAMPMLYLIGLPNRGNILHLLLGTILTAYVVVSRAAGQLFSRSLLVFLGKISFGLYLAHLPVICSTAYPIYFALLHFLSPASAAFAASSVLIALSIAAGWVLWFIADRPAIAFSRCVADALKKGKMRRCAWNWRNG